MLQMEPSWWHSYISLTAPENDRVGLKILLDLLIVIFDYCLDSRRFGKALLSQEIVFFFQSLSHLADDYPLYERAYQYLRLHNETKE